MLGFPCSSVINEFVCSAGIRLRCRRLGFNSWVWKIPWRRKCQSTPVFFPGKSHGQRRLAGCSSWVARVRHDLRLNHHKCILQGFFFFYFTIWYWFCHTSTWIRHVYTCIPHSEPPSHLPPHPIPLGHPSAPAPSTLYHALNLDWCFVSHMIIYMVQCHSRISSCPHPLPQSPKDRFFFFLIQKVTIFQLKKLDFLS